MNNWQTFYSAGEQAIILAKHQRGIGFPAELTVPTGAQGW